MDNLEAPHPSAGAFARFYDGNSREWGLTSGPGSNPYDTIEYRAFLEKFIKMNGVRSVVDFGCGDWQFSRFIDFGSAQYLGLDVVEKLIEANTGRFASERVRFQLSPVDPASIPPGDLLIIKDVLQHLPNHQIMELQRVLFGRFRHVLLTNSYQKLSTQRNVEINVGQFRCLDLMSPPFSFRGAYIFEFTTGVWERIRTFLYQQ